MSSVVRCFRVKIIYEAGFGDKVMKQYRDGRDGSRLVDLKHSSVTDKGDIKAVGT